jgi:glycosyltransferase involved in cell wall biosynthesis
MSIPPLTIAIPTYQRPEELAEAVRSVFAAMPSDRGAVELLVSDDSPADETERVAAEVLKDWDGPSRYVRIPPTAGAVGNFNNCVTSALGRWVLILHDDDRLLPGAVPWILDAIARLGPDERVLLFGVRVVDGKGRVRRRQEFRRERLLDPAAALRRVLAHSSFVRFPAIVVRGDAYADAGPFDAEVGGATDFDMWVRLFGAWGVRCVPATTCEYVVHAGALTTRMFNGETVAAVDEIFARARRTGVLSQAAIRRCQADFYGGFVLGGAVRHLRAGDRAGAREVLRLFDAPLVRRSGVSWRWLAVRLAVSALAR